MNRTFSNYAILTFLLSFALVTVFITALSLNPAEALSVGKITVGKPTIENNRGYAVGIILSDSCIKLVKVGSKTCPSYEVLAPIYDNSIAAYSGSFKTINGFYQRDATNYKNSMGFYQHDPAFRVFVDPVKTDKIPLIIIAPKLEEYHLDGQMNIREIKDTKLKDSKADSTIRTISHTRHMNENCTEAIIGANNWKIVLTDTINFMKSSCDPSQTQIKTITTIIKPITEHKIAESYDYKLKTQKEYVLKNCLKSYGTCNPPNPNLTHSDETMKPKIQKTLTNTSKNHYVVELIE